MNFFFHTGQAFLLFNKIIDLVESNIAKASCPVGGVEKTVFDNRLVQKIVSYGTTPFIKICIANIKKENKLLSSTPSDLNLNGLILNSNNGQVKVAPKYFFRLIAEFFYEWLKGLKAILVGFTAAHFKAKVTIVFGVPQEAMSFEGSDKYFQNFCKFGTIGPLTSAKHLIVQSTAPIQGSSSRISYTPSPLIESLKICDIGFFSRVALLLTHLTAPIRLAFYILRSRLNVLLSRDFALLHCVNTLAKKDRIASMIITNSNFTDQPLWMRKNKSFKVHKVHYSQNSRPTVFNEEPSEIAHPSFRYVSVDEHWIWTKGYGEFLKEQGHNGPIHIVGPIMFYLPEEAKKKVGDVIRISIFDITPIYDHLAEKIGVINNYHSTKNMYDFLSQIVSVAEELEKNLGKKIELLLKHKRNFNSNHDKKYIEFANSLSAENKIILMKYDVNIFSLIGSSDLVISAPYSSPAYIASDMGIPSIYFDSSGELKPTFEPANRVMMASSREELKNEMIKLLNQSGAR